VEVKPHEPPSLLPLPHSPTIVLARSPAIRVHARKSPVKAGLDLTPDAGPCTQPKPRSLCCHNGNEAACASRRDRHPMGSGSRAQRQWQIRIRRPRSQVIGRRANRIL
jgi:hypothetical protein